MENFLKRMFNGEKSEKVHSEFIKFSKGIFGNKYLLDAKKQANKFSIKAGAEFANFLVRRGLEKVQNDIDIKGIIVYTFDIRGDIDFEIENVKQFMGIKQVVINTKISPQKITSLMDKYPRAFFALSFETEDYQLKIKAKAPKNVKPSNKGESEVKADFCSLKTSDASIVNDLFFDFPSFKEISINHSIQINEIILPKEETDPVKIREKAVRKGKIIRKVVIDGKTIQKEKDFEA